MQQAVAKDDLLVRSEYPAVPVLQEKKFHNKRLAAAKTVAPVVRVKCHLCERDYADQAMLKRHLREVHQEACPNQQQFRPARDTIDGTFQCAHCLHAHRTLQDLQLHIESGSCTAFDPHKPCTTTLALHPISHQILQESGERALIQWIKQWPNALSHWSLSHCSLCGLKVATNKMSAHMSHSHPKLKPGILALLPGLHRTLHFMRQPAKCPLCGFNARNMSIHQCTILIQTAAVQVIARIGTDHPDVHPNHRPDRRQGDLCNRVFSSAGKLQEGLHQNGTI